MGMRPPMGNKGRTWHSPTQKKNAKHVASVHKKISERTPMWVRAD